MKSNYKQLGQFIRQVDVRNSEGKEENLLGVSVQKKFIPSIANTVGTDFKKYKVVKKGQFTYIPDTSRRGDKIGIALLEDYEEGLVSNVYTVFEIIDEKQLIPEYLMLWFSRPEFDRYARFKSHGSVREIFDWNELCMVELPVPDIEKQRKIVKAYKTITDRIALKQKINDNLEVAMQAIYKSYFIDFEPFKSQKAQSTKLGNIPDDWTICKFSNLCELLNGRAYSQDELLDSGKYRVLRVGNFFTQSNWYYSDMELEDNKYCYPDDLLFCWSASFGLYIWNDVKTIYHYHIWKVDFSKTTPLYREYIYLYLKQEVEKLSKEGHGSVMAHLTKSGVENLDIISPPESVIEEFHNKILPIIEHRKLVEKEIQQLRELQSAYLSRLSH
jgi:restriction endonuclease S subunit